MTVRNSLIAFATGAAVLTIGAPAIAQEVAVPAPEKGANLTIYSGDFALVRDRRSVRLPASSAELAFTGVSGQMQPETALLEVLSGDALTITEQTFNFDVLTPERLMRGAVGQEVGVVLVNTATGEETIKRAKILSVTNGLVIEMDGHIHTGAPGRIVFDKLPEGVRAQPALLMSVRGEAKQETSVDLSYLTSGLSWNADYVAQYDPDAGRMDLKAWATVTNTTGVNFKDANIKLVAGDVNRAPKAPTPHVMRAMEAQMASAPMADGVGQEGLVAYHMYTLPGQTTVNNRETKQLALLEGRGVAVKRELSSRSQPYFFTARMREPTTESHADVELTFTNNAAAKLGMPLPAGILRVYSQDSSGAPQFLGESQIGHTPEGQDVNAALGRDFDVTVLREQTNFVQASDTIVITNWRVTVKNAKAKAVAVQVIEQMPGTWEVTRETLSHEKLNAAEAQWTVQVPAKGETVLEYNVRTRL